MNYSVDTDLLIKYFSGLAKPEEALHVDEWSQSDTDNRLFFEELKSSWMPEQNYQAPDVDANWNDFVLKTAIPKTKINSKSRILRWLPYAAAVVVLLGIGYLLKPNSGEKIINEFVFSAPNTQTYIDKEASVTLEQGAQLIELKNDSIGNYYKLTGAASFWVMNSGLTILLPSDIWLRDIGTEFSIEGNAQSAKIIVNDGIVEVWNTSAKHQVSKNQVLNYAKATNTFSIEDYKGNFDYKDYTLQQVCDSVGAYFHTILKVENTSLENKMLTLSGKELSLPQVLEIIATTLDVKYDSKGIDTIVFKAN